MYLRFLVVVVATASVCACVHCVFVCVLGFWWFNLYIVISNVANAHVFFSRIRACTTMYSSVYIYFNFNTDSIPIDRRCVRAIPVIIEKKIESYAYIHVNSCYSSKIEKKLSIHIGAIWCVCVCVRAPKCLRINPNAITHTSHIPKDLKKRVFKRNNSQFTNILLIYLSGVHIHTFF